MNINSAVTLGAISSGIGYSTMEETLAVVNVPFMSPTTYQKYQDEVSYAIHATAWKAMEDAGKEEFELATQLGEVDSDNVPYITVIADGAWAKRSYNVNYDAASGVACIIGYRTQKLLFLGIKNKYCCVCTRAEEKNTTVLDHVCFKNWSGTSTSMEAAIISEGFKQSIQMHGLIYLKLVGDGDSSVHRKLIEARPYGHRLVQKVECKNHLLRNFSTKLRELYKKKISNSKNMPVSPSLRKVVDNNSCRLRTAITKAIKYRRTEEIPFEQQVSRLCKDLKNVVSHVFGEHGICEELAYFNCSKRGTENNYVPEMIHCGLLQDIEIITNRLIFNATSLILNMDTNLAEQYNSVVCKFVGGKRINFSLKGSYQTRCEAAVVSYNNKGGYHHLMQKATTSKSPSAYTKKYIQKIKRRRFLQKSRRLSNRTLFKKSVKKAAQSDRDYGPEASTEPDLPEHIYKEKEEGFLKCLEKTKEEIKHLETETRGQASNALWKQERAVRLTASHFGAICKMRASTPRHNKLKNILYSNFVGNNSTRYGCEKEPFAIRQFETEFNVTVQSCGLFVDEDNCVLAASPDGLVGNDAIIEVKCPAIAATVDPKEAVTKKKITFAVLSEGNDLILKRNHNYFFQIQGQLHITKRKFCYFVVWSPHGMLVEKIERDVSFWNTKMLIPLKKFYFENMLPELVDATFPRGMEMRNCNKTKDK